LGGTDVITELPPSLAFTPAELERAWVEWGCNCGPAALAVAVGLKPDDVLPHIAKFDERRYTNPTMMAGALRSLGIDHRWSRDHERAIRWPIRGLARIQWGGPWTDPGVPIPARYRHSHWVAVATIQGMATAYNLSGRGIFDVNCPHWINFEDWEKVLVPRILKENEPKADGKWWVTDAIEVRP
jgi:hypothetical protein